MDANDGVDGRGIRSSSFTKFLLEMKTKRSCSHFCCIPLFILTIIEVHNLLIVIILLMSSVFFYQGLLLLP